MKKTEPWAKYDLCKIHQHYQVLSIKYDQEIGGDFQNTLKSCSLKGPRKIMFTRVKINLKSWSHFGHQKK